MTFVHVESREPGLLAVVSKPEEQGFDVEIVQRSGVQYQDTRDPTARREAEQLAQWQCEALDL